MASFYFCPKCGSSLKTEKIEEKDRLVCTSCSYIFYQNSKPTVAVLLEKDGMLMLTRRNINPFKGFWDLPGGFVEEGEHPHDAVKREILEETGLQVEIVDFLGVYMDTYGDGENQSSTMNLHYLARFTGGIEKPGSDVDQIGWFTPEEIPENIAFNNCKHAAEEWKREKRNGDKQ
jgi:8-oxo-dGTP diphosphatase